MSEESEKPHAARALTGTQRTVLELAAMDFPDKWIASEVRLSIHGVRWHWRVIKQKLDCHSRASAVSKYYHFRQLAEAQQTESNGL